MKKIATKITILSLVMLAVLGALAGILLARGVAAIRDESAATLEQTLREDFDRLVRTQVEHAVSTLSILQAKVDEGVLDPDTARALGADLLRKARYDKEGYFWADTVEGVNVVLLGKADVEGQSRWNSQDAKGKYLIQEIIKNGSQPGGGFTDYWFPKAGQTEPLPKRGYSLLFEPFGWVVGTGAYIDDINAIVAAKQARITDTANLFSLVLAIVLAASLVAAGVASRIVGLRIAVPVARAAAALDDIAQGEGDLTRRLPAMAKDETGDIARGFNLFVEKLGLLVGSIRETTDALAGVGHNLSANLVESASGLNQISANIGNMQERISSQSRSIGETTSTLDGIVQGIADLNALVEQQAQAVTHSSAAVEQMVSNIAAVAATVDRISERFEQLTGASETGKTKLGDVNRVIVDIERQSGTLGEANTVIAGIAAQTNLLAMNAAIEAAHAGEAGRGFAVVADEIRKLAENAALQSKTVGDNIKAIRRSIEQAVDASREAERAFDATRAMIQEVNQLESTVKLSMVEQNEGSRQILQSLADMNSVTEGVRTGSSSMAAGSRQIQTEMNRLAAFTEEIAGGMREIAAGAQEINLAINGISDLGLANRDQIARLEAETARFKTEGQDTGS